MFAVIWHCQEIIRTLLGCARIECVLYDPLDVVRVSEACQETILELQGTQANS